jgi:hypothetical protein
VAGLITLGASASLGDDYPAIQSSGLLIDGAGAAVIDLPEVEALWAVNSNTVSYGANVALLPKARSAVAANPALSYSEFTAAAKDAAGNTYAVGYQTGNSPFTYGNVSVTGSATGSNNAVIVKYDSAGTALWARSTVTGPNYGSEFWGVAVSPDGYVYAAGFQTNNYNNTNINNYDYGTGNVKGSFNGTGFNAVIVKYSNEGAVLKAQSTVSGNTASQFRGVAVDGSGVYAVGYQNKSVALFYYGTTISAQGFYGGNNSVIVKYNSDLVAQWEQYSTGGGGLSRRASGIPAILIYKEYKEFNRQVKEVEEVFRDKTHFFLSFFDFGGKISF